MTKPISNNTEKIEKEDLRKYNNEQLKIVRRQVVFAFKKGKTHKEIHDFIGLSMRKVGEICREYIKTGKISQPKQRGRKVGEKRLLSKEQEKELKNLLIDKTPNQLKFECFLWTPKVVKELIKQKYKIELGKTTIRNYLESWGMSCQRPAKQAYKQDKSAVKCFEKQIYPEIKKRAAEENAELLFADETGINNQCYNPMGYSLKNNPPVVKVNTSRETVNMLSAVSPSGQHRFILYRETTTQQKLIEFMEKLLKEKPKDKSKIFLFLDNLKVHHGKLVKTWIEEHKNEISIFYFPSYSPDINPQEYLNNILKQNIHSGLSPKNADEIEKKTMKFMNEVGESKIKMIFEHPKLRYQKD